MKRGCGLRELAVNLPPPPHPKKSDCNRERQTPYRDRLLSSYRCRVESKGDRIRRL